MLNTTVHGQEALSPRRLCCDRRAVYEVVFRVGGRLSTSVAKRSFLLVVWKPCILSISRYSRTRKSSLWNLLLVVWFGPGNATQTDVNDSRTNLWRFADDVDQTVDTFNPHMGVKWRVS